MDTREIKFLIATSLLPNKLKIMNLFESLGKNLKLVNTNMSLTSYTGHKLNIAVVTIRHKNENHKLEFYVVRSKAPFILGLSDSIALNLIKR